MMVCMAVLRRVSRLFESPMMIWLSGMRRVVGRRRARRKGAVAGRVGHAVRLEDEHLGGALAPVVAGGAGELVVGHHEGHLRRRAVIGVGHEGAGLRAVPEWVGVACA